VPVALLGGTPSPIPDDPISAVLLAFFVGSAVLHMAIFQINLRRSHKFVFSVLLFGFSMARITALTVRIAWAHYPTNSNIAIAANVFTAAGVLLLFIVNLLFAQRIMTAYHPYFGWNRSVLWAFRLLLASVVAVLVMVITVSVHLFFANDPDVRAKERNVQLFAGTYLTVLAFLPIPIVIISRAIVFLRARRLGDKDFRVVQDKFGAGSFRAKIWLLVSTSALLTLGAGFRVSVNFMGQRPANDPAWYHSKAVYYCFNYVIEILVVYAYGIARFDRRFHIPDGSSAPGHYSRGLGLPINREDEVFGPAEADGDSSSGTGQKDDDGIGGADWEEQYAYTASRGEMLVPEKKVDQLEKVSGEKTTREEAGQEKLSEEKASEEKMSQEQGSQEKVSEEEHGQEKGLGQSDVEKSVHVNKESENSHESGPQKNHVDKELEKEQESGPEKTGTTKGSLEMKKSQEEV